MNGPGSKWDYCHRQTTFKMMAEYMKISIHRRSFDLRSNSSGTSELITRIQYTIDTEP